MKNYFKTYSVLFFSVFFITSCSKDSEGNLESTESYNTTFKITDAPIDNANVNAVFVTISDVRIDGKSIEGFNKTTIDLATLVNGKTETLGNIDLQARSYSKLVLVLDYETDVNGNSPGCYVKMANGEKDKLEAAFDEITVIDTFEVFAQTANEVIIDFDLRKTIKEEQGAIANDFKFVTTSELSAGIRTINEEITGKIKGSANDVENTSDKIIVFAYQKGTFNAETETKGSGDSKITFSNAVTSSNVNPTTGTYSLNFLSEGEYELVFVSYKEDGGAFYFNALLEAESTTGLNLGAISVTSAIQINANVTIKGTK